MTLANGKVAVCLEVCVILVFLSLLISTLT